MAHACQTYSLGGECGRFRSSDSSLATQGIWGYLTWGYLELKEEMKERKEEREEERRKEGKLAWVLFVCFVFLSRCFLCHEGLSGCALLHGGTAEKPDPRQDIR